MRTKTIQFCTEQCWDYYLAISLEVDYFSNLVMIAKEVAKELDKYERVPETNRRFWVMDEGSNTPMLMETRASIVVEYDADFVE